VIKVVGNEENDYQMSSNTNTQNNDNQSYDLVNSVSISYDNLNNNTSIFSESTPQHNKQDTTLIIAQPIISPLSLETTSTMTTESTTISNIPSNSSMSLGFSSFPTTLITHHSQNNYHSASSIFDNNQFTNVENTKMDLNDCAFEKSSYLSTKFFSTKSVDHEHSSNDSNHNITQRKNYIHNDICNKCDEESVEKKKM